ncbi:M23 family metallopeptidase [Longimicrobium sp.]|uniref:murein hydrolase activator EnvC family protein n=1 Tax=Longimicrobium sp. TaxID=2029185 RepID=UPI002E35DFE7|nr:M23 family metallopeptidase [Longimicrobium sp.]HEX6041438.1 M23 family metallopeptidase [Longimicrobium sp.]
MLIALALVHALSAVPADTPDVTVRAAPERVRVERGASQYLNFDFLIHNGGADTLEITRVEVSVYDGAGGLQLRKLVNENGPSPSALLLSPDRVLPPGADGMIFNPFAEFPREVELARLRYDVELRPRRADGERGEPIARTVDVMPEAFAPRTRLRMPLQGRVLVWDGHDFLSHHRRWNWTHPVLAAHCITSNPGRYAYDFVLLGADDSLHAGDGKAHTQWYGFGAEVRAPAAGRVVAATGDRPDDGNFDLDALCADELAMYGNFVVIDHGNGEMSVLAHLQQGSVAVRVGDEVGEGDVVARVGSSGSSLFPHLHYQLVTGTQHGAEGLPSYFPGLRVRRGAGWVDAPDGQVDTGDIIDAR